VLFHAAGCSSRYSVGELVGSVACDRPLHGASISSRRISNGSSGNTASSAEVAPRRRGGGQKNPCRSEGPRRCPFLRSQRYWMRITIRARRAAAGVGNESKMFTDPNDRSESFLVGIWLPEWSRRSRQSTLGVSTGAHSWDANRAGSLVCVLSAQAAGSCVGSGPAEVRSLSGACRMRSRVLPGSR
jgi:hypothetical protein